MKILCVIAHFGPGGAQRQMANLACGLKSRGHHVEMFIYYHEFDFFRHIVEKSDIPIHEVHKRAGVSFKVLLSLVQLLKKGKFEAGISFMRTPNTFAELALFFSGTKLIVAECSSHNAGSSRFRMVSQKALYGLADVVVSNSYPQFAWINQTAWLKNKSKTVYNGYPIKLGESIKK